MKKKYLYINNMAAPYQVKFCYALQKYFEAEFWFYEYVDETRPEWWKIPLGNKCRIMRASGKLPKVGYFSFGLFVDMMRYKPDIVVLSGFMNWHILIVSFAKLLGAKVVIMSEPLRFAKNDDQGTTELMSKENSPRYINFLRNQFTKADLYVGMGKVAKDQFIKEFKFPVNKVTSMPYPQDIEEYYYHPQRRKKFGDPIIILFANRLVDRYQPLMALKVFKVLSSKYLHIKMLMNSDGSQKKECLEYIKNNKIYNVEFLDEIDSWNNMNLIYKKSDILILPCVYSNGNGTLIEAGASGMGVVMSNQINNMEGEFINRKNCFICKLNEDDFVKAVSAYIDNPDLILKHGELSRNLVKHKRNDYVAENYFETFKKYGLVD